MKIAFSEYPVAAQEQLFKIRAAIFEVAEEEGIDKIEETLKWGEPSYLTKGGSTIRMAWKPKSPDTVSVYFNCQTTLVETFREVHGDKLECIGSREVALPVSGAIPMPELKSCLSMALRYHKVKHLPLLGF